MVHKGYARFLFVVASAARIVARVTDRAKTERAVALAQQAVRHHQAGELNDAIRLYEQVGALITPSAAVLSNLGDAYRRVGRYDDACTAFQRALRQNPKLPAAHFNLALALERLGRRQDAALAYANALSLDNNLIVAAVAFLQVLRDDQQYERAIVAFESWRTRVPDSAELRRAIGNLLADVFRVDEAIAHFEQAIAMALQSAELRADYAAALIERGQVIEAVAELRLALELEPSLVRAHASLVYLLAFVPGVSQLAIREEARRFELQHAGPVPRLTRRSAAREAGRKLRIGYFSPDFRAHPIASFLPAVLGHHERARVEVYCYSNVTRPDDVTESVRNACDVFRDILPLSDDAAAAQISEDGVDILVDLAMHSGGSRPLLFARKPAPIQACWLAYPGTTGIAAVDYRITDSIIDPAETDAEYSETSLRLPGCFWCYEPPPDSPDVNELPALSTGYITFGSPNSFKKVNAEALELWANVLSAVPGSRMLIVAPAGAAWKSVEAAFAARGVDAARLERLPHAPRAQYFAAVQRMDCVLDTTPYNGGTATFDALYLGVPVVTLRGDCAAARSGASILHHLDLSKLVASSQGEYVSAASALTRDLAELGHLRSTLRERMLGSVLMDPRAFTRGLEGLYFQMLEAWLASEVETKTS